MHLDKHQLRKEISLSIPCLKCYEVIDNMEMGPDIENITISEYLKYDATKERRLWDNDDLFRTGAENMKQMGHDIVQDSIWEQDDDSEEDQEEDGDDGDTFDMWDITVEEVEFDFNPTKDLEELKRLLAKEPQSNFTEIQVDRDIISLEAHYGTVFLAAIQAVHMWWCLDTKQAARKHRKLD
ncbi:hypothetical protein Tco_0174462 [Tanacetum coccineum]